MKSALDIHIPTEKLDSLVPKDSKALSQVAGGGLGAMTGTAVSLPLMKEIGHHAALLHQQGGGMSSRLLQILAQVVGWGGMGLGAYGGYKGTGAAYDALQLPNKPLFSSK